MVLPAPSSAVVSLVCAFTGGFSGTGLWSLLEDYIFAVGPQPSTSALPLRSQDCHCECDCQPDYEPSRPTSTSPPSWYIDIRYAGREEALGFLLLAAVLLIACLAAGYQLACWRFSYRSEARVSQDVELSSDAQFLLAVKNGARDGRTDSSVSSPARSRRRGGGVLVKSIAGP